MFAGVIPATSADDKRCHDAPLVPARPKGGKPWFDLKFGPERLRNARFFNDSLSAAPGRAGGLTRAMARSRKDKVSGTVASNALTRHKGLVKTAACGEEAPISDGRCRDPEYRVRYREGAMTDETLDIQWYIARDGQQHGPLSDAELRLFVNGGHLVESDLIWRVGLADWKPAFEVFPPKPKTADVQAASTQATEAPQKQTKSEPAAKETEQSSKTVATKPVAKTTAATASTTPTATQEPTAAPAGPAKVQPAASNPATMAHPMARAAATQTTTSATSTAAQAPTPTSQPSTQTPTTAGAQQAPAPSPTSQDTSVIPMDSRPEILEENSGGPGRRIAIAASIVAILLGGGWFAVKNNPQAAAFAAAALNITTSSQDTTAADSADATNDVKVVKAPDAPAGTPPEETATNDVAAAPVPTPAEPAVTPPPAQEINTAAITPPEPPAPSEPKVDERFKTSPLWNVVRQEFPDWYGERMREIEQLSLENKPKGEVDKYAMKWLVQLRRENAAAALAASSPKLVNVASAFLLNLQAFKAHSTDACYSFISKGETSPTVVALVESGEKSATMEAQATAIFEAIADGRKTPQTRDRPQKPDYDMLAAELGQLGWSQADLQLFANPQALARAAPERVCQMVQDWFSAHIAIKDQAVQDRLLFETLRPVISG